MHMVEINIYINIMMKNKFYIMSGLMIKMI
jgi:hypothetical protein